MFLSDLVEGDRRFETFKVGYFQKSVKNPDIERQLQPIKQLNNT